jgi:hypothetical protein
MSTTMTAISWSTVGFSITRTDLAHPIIKEYGNRSKSLLLNLTTQQADNTAFIIWHSVPFIYLQIAQSCVEVG